MKNFIAIRNYMNSRNLSPYELIRMPYEIWRELEMTITITLDLFSVLIPRVLLVRYKRCRDKMQSLASSFIIWGDFHIAIKCLILISISIVYIQQVFLIDAHRVCHNWDFLLYQHSTICIKNRLGYHYTYWRS